MTFVVCLRSGGSDYEAQFLEYRNRHLEHPRDLAGRSLRHGPTRIMHTDGPAKQRHRGRSPNDVLPYLIDEVTLELSEGGRVHYFHVKGPSAGVGVAERGDLLGHLDDK